MTTKYGRLRLFSGEGMTVHDNESKKMAKKAALIDNRITFKELCAKFPHWSERTLRSWREKGMPGQRVMGGKLMFDLQEVTLWIERHS